MPLPRSSTGLGFAIFYRSLYPSGVADLLACPFCRSLFTRDETAICPHCDLHLVELSHLPPRDDSAETGTGEAPEDRVLSPWFLGRGRGACGALALLGLVLFFQPWAKLERPDEVVLSGFDIARGGATWLFGGAIAWFLLLPLLLSRRTVRSLVGVRALVVTAALMTLGETLLLRLRPPTDSAWMQWGLSYLWGLDASMMVACLAAGLGLRLGGSTRDFRDLPPTKVTDTERGNDPLH